MRLSVVSTPLQLATRMFKAGGQLNPSMMAPVIAVSIMQIVAVVIASDHDGTLYMTPPDKGLLQHYGAWAILITDPLIIAASGYAYLRFRAAFRTLPTPSDLASKGRFRHLVAPFLGHIRGSSSAAYLYILLLATGLLCWANNIHQTIRPQNYYNHDVFDGYSHLLGFLAYKACLFTSWVIVYPIAGYEFILLTISTGIILARARRRRLLLPYVTHPDNCYGLKNIGTLNIALIAPYLLVFAVMISLLVTHQTLYRSIEVPLAFFSLFALIMSFVVIMPVYGLLKHARKTAYHDLVRRAGSIASRNDTDISKFTVDRLCYSNATASPYSTTAKFTVSALRLSFASIAYIIHLAQKFF